MHLAESVKANRRGALQFQPWQVIGMAKRE